MLDQLGNGLLLGIIISVASVALSLMSICRPNDEVLVTDSVYFPTRMITSKLLKEFNILDPYEM